MANDQDTFHADLCELLTILGMGDHSRPQSPHEVFQEALGVLRERLSLPAPTAPSPCLGEREAVARLIVEASSDGCWSYGREPHHAQRVWLQTSDAIIAQHIEPLRTENETLRAERDAAIARAEEARAAVAWTNEVTPEINDWGQATVCLAPEEFERMRALTTPEPPHDV